MEYVLEEENNKITIYLPQEIDHHSVEQIREKVDRKIERNSIQNVTFDFRKTTFMDSSGIGLLMGRYKLVNYIGGSVMAINVSDRLNRHMKLAGIQRYIKIKGGQI